MGEGRWTGFYRLDRLARLRKVVAFARLSVVDKAVLEKASALPHSLSDAFIENAVGSFPIPLGFAVNFVVDGREVVVPMAVEESSVVAAASHGAKMAGAGGGFVTQVMEPVTIGQVEMRAVRDAKKAVATVRRKASAWRRLLDQAIPAMRQRGGGVTKIEARALPGRRLVVHIHVDTREAMGANVVNSLCERIAPEIQAAVGGTIGLRILSNLATERLATASFRVPVDAVGGMATAKAIVEANDFARVDPYRAATHNKGIMNGIDPVALATGNDWRAIEAGAHAYAAHGAPYSGLTTYRLSQGMLEASLTLPLAVGTVGGVTRLHPVAQACLHVLGNPDAKRLAGIMASVGLAQNLSALRALATEGIQAGHMALHARNLALAAGISGTSADRAADRMAREGDVSSRRARELARVT